MALPASEDTRADRMTYVIKEVVNHIMFENDTGANLNQGDFAVVGPFAAIADEDVLNGAEGSFFVQEGIQVETDELKTGENTFGTLGQEVFWDSTNNEFSDTETVGYDLVGYLTKVKDSEGVIRFDKLRYVEEVTS